MHSVNRALRRPLTVLVAGLVAMSLAVPAHAATQTGPSSLIPETVGNKPAAEQVESVPVTTFKSAPARRDTEAPSAKPRAAKVTWPVVGSSQVPVARTKVSPRGARAGTLPLWIAPASATAPEHVQVRVNPRAAGDALSFSLRRTDGGTARANVRVTVDYSGFADAVGGDWSSRLRILPTDKGGPADVGNRNDAVNQTLTADLPVAGSDRTYVVTAAPEGPTGDYKATSLSPSGTWQVSTQSGGFDWSYPMRTPPVPGGLSPDLTLSYSSNAVDGRTVSTNNQPSWLGEGWSMWPGYIERSYKACAEDLGGNNGQRKTGDLCWETDNATLSFGEQSGRLVYSGGVWRPETDDGTKVERLYHEDPTVNGDDNGEYWRVTTSSGTKYYFGLNKQTGWSTTTQSAWTTPVYGNDAYEPCNKPTYAASTCMQAYRWNLDYVVDAHGNSMTYYYTAENNNYGQNLGASTSFYARGGVLSRIEYGTRAGSEQTGPAPARVMLGSADRCVPGQNCAVHNAVSWPDVPWDSDCQTPTCPTKVSPTFWTTKRLASVTTQVATGGGTYRDVDRWDLAHTYPSPGDVTTAALWLNGITHAGQAGTAIALPPVTFDGTMKPNRVNSASDGLPAMNKMRMTTVTTESGGDVNVVYKDPECVPGAAPKPDTNTKLCFPARWAMPPEPEPRDDWFHKYVVLRTVEHDKVTDAKPIVTNYDYVGGGAWAFDDNPLVEPKEQSWSQWRGFEKVYVRKGDPTLDEHKAESRMYTQYFRGMHGDNGASGPKTVNIIDSTGKALPDSEPLSGMVREQITYNGVGGAEIGGTINDPWIRQTGRQLNVVSNQVETVRTVERTRLSGGSVRTTQVDTKYDQFGNPTEVNDLGDVKVASDDQCTTTSYVPNVEKMLVSLPSRETVVGAACEVTPSYPAEAISDARTSYDDKPFGAAPDRGLATKSEIAKSYSGSTPTYLTTNTSMYDAFGRILESKDALGRTTTTAYSETNGLTTASRTTNPLGHVSSRTIDPAWGQPVKEIDPNNRVTTLVYDALGRIWKVWKPGRVQTQSPHLQFGYGVRNSSGPNWVRTQTLMPNGNQVTTYDLLDGFLRSRQTQMPSPRGGRILADTLYDTRGLAVVNRPAYYDEKAGPGTSLAEPPDAGAVPASTVTTHDGAERKVHEIYLEKNVEKWRTTTSYGGDQVTVTPPAGGTVTTTFTDARGRTIALLQWHGRAPAGDYDETRYGYTKRGDLASIKDAAGNAWRYEYDVLGRKVKADDPDKGVSTMTYDDAGQQRSATDARGKTVVARYDALGRALETRLGSDTGTLLTKSVFDTVSRGALTSAARIVNGHEYVRAVTGYDAAGRPEAETVTIPSVEGKLAGTYKTSHTYAADNSPSSTTLPALGDLPAETLNYGYDDLGMSDSLTGVSSYVTDTEYTSLGEVGQLELGVGAKRLWRSMYYEDGTRRLSEALTTKLEPSGAFMHDLTYGYDPVGNVTRIGDRVAGSPFDTQCFTHDYLRRTTEAWTAASSCDSAPSSSTVGGPAPYWQQFTYDQTGNRTRLVGKGVEGEPDVTSAYNYAAPGDGADRPHAVTSVTTGSSVASYSYDTAGNTVRRPGPDGAEQTVSWNDEGLLASVGSTSYLYDAGGVQLVRRDPGKVTLFVGGGEISLDTTSGSVRGTRYYDGIGTRTSADFVWTVADHHGTSQAAIDETTLAVTPRRFDLFGALRGSDTESWPGGDRGFVGGTTNEETGLTRLGAREYDASLGRFISVDPLVDPQDPQTLNAYAYSNNNPATMSDPDGLSYIVDVDGHVRAPSAKAMSNPVIKKSVNKRIARWSKVYQKRADRERKKGQVWRKSPTKKSPTAVKDLDLNPHTDNVWKVTGDEWHGGDGENPFLEGAKDAVNWYVDIGATVNSAAAVCALSGNQICVAAEMATLPYAVIKSSKDCFGGTKAGCADLALTVFTLGLGAALKGIRSAWATSFSSGVEATSSVVAVGWGGVFRAVNATNPADRTIGIISIFSPLAGLMPDPGSGSLTSRTPPKTVR